VPFPGGRLGEADLEQIWRSPDQSALLVGGRLLVLGPSGGGHGDPFTREPPAVLDDVLDGYFSENLAWRRYGLVIVDGRLDEAATARLRAGHMGG
jgi:N-methylhydantoinase B